MDETKLTAYALGELSGAERAEVAAHLVSNGPSRQFVAEMRATACLLSDELARESFGGLSDLQHAAIEIKLSETMRLPQIARRRRRVRRERMVLVMSLAASVLILCGVVSVLLPFVYQRVHLASMGEAKRDTHPFRIAPTLPAPETGLPSEMALRTPDASRDRLAPHIDDPEEAIAEEQYVPPPDDRLATGGSGREEASFHDAPMIGAHPLNNTDIKPAPQPPQITRTPPATPPDGHNPPAVARNEVPTPRPKVNADASLQPGQLAPDKERRAVPNSGSASNAIEAYAHLLENPFVKASDEPVSGFSAGVDTASYSNIRRFLTHGKLPPTDAVRIEEMLNYFPVRPSATAGEGLMDLQVETGACAWRPEHRLARVCVQARELPPVARPPVNLVFVIDISQRMCSEKNKLPLLKQAMRLLVSRLTSRDRVALIAYSHEAGIVLPPTAGDDKAKIGAAIERLETGGSSNGGQGIEVAYEVASRSPVAGGVNRVILATDGNWDVGVTERASLATTIREKSRGNNVSLTVLGVGMNNLKDATLQNLASAGNGSYAYIDTLDEARKILADQANGSLVAAARDVKVHVTFNPAVVELYRLIGYERRVLSKDDLTKRGGEMGAGQSVTALYEVIVARKPTANDPTEMLTATVNYADVNGGLGEVEVTGQDRATPLPRTSVEFRFASAVAEFGLLLRDSDYKGNATYNAVLEHLRDSIGPDDAHYRRELVQLIRKAKALAGK